MAGGPPHRRRAEFEEVALPHMGALFNFALSLTRNRRDAEDLVQEAFLRAFRFFDTYRPGTHIKAWLFRILRNTFINRYRAARVRPDEVELAKIDLAYEKMIDEEFLRRKRPPSPERLVTDGVLDEEVQQALDELPEEYRSVVLMALVEEMSYKEIAAALAIPMGTVMSRLHRGRKMLQAALMEYVRRKGILRSGRGVSPSEEAGNG